MYTPNEMRTTAAANNPPIKLQQKNMSNVLLRIEMVISDWIILDTPSQIHPFKQTMDLMNGRNKSYFSL